MEKKNCKAIRLNWQNRWWVFECGWDEDFSFYPFIRLNKVSLCLGIFHYWIGVAW